MTLLLQIKLIKLTTMYKFTYKNKEIRSDDITREDDFVYIKFGKYELMISKEEFDNLIIEEE